MADNRIFFTRRVEDPDILEENGSQPNGSVQPVDQTFSFKSVGTTFGRNDVYYQTLDRNKTLKQIHIDKYLIFWGLRNQVYGGDGVMTSRSGYMRLILLFMSLMFLRWVVIICIPYLHLDVKYAEYLGDFTRKVGTWITQLYFQVTVFFGASTAFVIQLYCFRKRKMTKYFHWMKMFELMKGTITHEDLGVTEYVGQLIWQETRDVMKRWYTLMKYFLVGGSLCVLIYSHYKQIRAGDWYIMGWIMIEMVWIYYLSAHFIGLAALFRCVTYYFHIRMKKLVRDAYLINLHHKSVNLDDLSQITLHFLTEFDQVCIDLARYNKFWQMYMAVFYGPGFFLMFFGITCIGVYSDQMTSAHWYEIFTIVMLTVWMWAYVVLLAARIPAHAKKLYLEMNTMCLHSYSEMVKTKMDNFIKRFSGKTIGFHVYDMFSVTHEFIYHVVIFTGTSYVLFIDSIVKERNLYKTQPQN